MPTVVVIAVSVLIATLASGNDPAGADRRYLNELAAPARDSALIGSALSARLRSPTLTLAAVQPALTVLLQRQRHDLQAASRIAAAPTLRPEQGSALDALRLRVSGLTGLRSVFAQASVTPNELSFFADRLLTSDVIWRDFFQRPAQAQLVRDGARGIGAPTSAFLADPNLAAAESMASLLTRLRTPPTQSAPRTLKLGVSGAAVTHWQHELNRWLRHSGVAQLAITGIYDTATEAATVRLQQSQHITADGVVGPLTRAALRKALTG